MESLREKHLACVVDNLSYFNDCKTSFAISECKSWINKIFDDVEALQQSVGCEDCKFGKYGVNGVRIELECSLNWRCSRGNSYLDKWEPKEP